MAAKATQSYVEEVCECVAATLKAAGDYCFSSTDGYQNISSRLLRCERRKSISHS